MHAFSPIHRLYFAYLGRIYALLYALNRRKILGMRLATVVRWSSLLLLLVGLLMDWPAPVMVFLLVVAVWIYYSFWRAKRENYNRFVPTPSPAAPDNPLGQSLPPNQKLPVRATGLFSVSGRDAALLLRPASYWRVPLGDHVVMAEEAPGKFLYQFFNAESLQGIRPGLLLFGPRPAETLAVTFLARWGPEYTRFGQDHESERGALPPAKRVTIYLSIADDEVRQLLQDTITLDARQARLKIKPGATEPGRP